MLEWYGRKTKQKHMTETFYMTRSMRIGSTVLTALLRAGLPLGSLTLLSVLGRKSGKIYTTYEHRRNYAPV